MSFPAPRGLTWYKRGHASEVFHYDGSERVPGKGGRWNSFVSFSDPDGNGWVVQERPAE